MFQTLSIAILSLSPSRSLAPMPPPPAPVASCLQKLKTTGARFRVWRNPRGKIRGRRVCQVPDAVILYRGKTGLRFGAAKVNCAFALRLMRFEKILQEEAQRAFKQPVRKLWNMGTYDCRTMLKWRGWLSEHSFGNAIDLGGVTLRSGRRTTVLRHYPRRKVATIGARKLSARARFWKRLARRLYDEKVFTVVLTPNWNKNHHNHLHLDGASYRVDGT